MSGFLEPGAGLYRVGAPTRGRPLRLALATAIAAAGILAGGAADARARARTVHHRNVAGSDMDRTLAAMAERDGLRPRPRREEARPPASAVPPPTRQRLAAPPLTGWGYGDTIPGAWPGF